jgi:trimeric autotransporter adhesin
MKWRGAAVGLLVAGCIPNLSGAPCHTDDNCPTRQYCDASTSRCQSGPPPPTRVVGLVVTTPAGIVPLGSMVQATATALLQSQDKQDVTATAVWSSTDSRVAQVSNDAGSQGTVSAVGTGEVNVVATLGANTGSVHLVVTNAELASLVVVVTRPVVAPRSDVACTAVGFFTDGTHADLSSLVSWSSSQSTVVSVSSVPGDPGTLTALGPGTAKVQASYLKLSGFTYVTVTNAALTGISLSPLEAWVAVGADLALVATGLFSDGSAQPITGNVQWTAADPALAFFTSAAPGDVEGFAPGTTLVQAQSGQLMASTTLVVSDAPLVALEVAPALPDPMGIGGDTAFNAWGTFADLGVLALTGQATWTSSAPDVVAVAPTSGASIGIDAGVADVGAASGTLLATANETVSPANPVAVLVWPPSASFPVFFPGALSAERTLADGTVEDITQIAGWSSSCPSHIAVATGDQGGSLVLRAPGSCTVSAGFAGVSGTGSAVASVQSVQSLALNREAVAIGVGGRVALTATAVFDDGSVRDVTPLSAWTSSTADVLLSGNGPEAGQALAADAGVGQLIATFGGATASASVTVGPAAPNLEVWPPLVQLHGGTRMLLRATAVWPMGDAVDVTAWTVFATSNPSVVEVANAAGRRGQLVGLTPGTSIVTASYGAATAATTASVVAPTPVTLTVSGPNTLPVGQSSSYRATAHFTDGSSQDVTAISAWTSSGNATLRLRGVGPSRGAAVALVEGAAASNALFAGTTGTAPVTVEKGTLQTLSLQVPPGPVPAGVVVQVSALAGFAGGVTLDVTGSATWFSSTPAVATVSSGRQGGLLTPGNPGTTQLTALFDGVQASAEVTVSPASLSGLSISPANPTGPVGVVVPLHALGTFSDGSQFDLTAQTRWTSSSPSRLAVSNGEDTRGLAMALLEGTSDVVAAVARPDATVVTTSTAFLANRAIPVGVSISPGNVVLSLSASPTSALTATASLSDGATRDVTSAVIWSVGDSSVVQVTPGGELTASRTGRTQVSATLGLLVGTAQVQINP